MKRGQINLRQSAATLSPFAQRGEKVAAGRMRGEATNAVARTPHPGPLHELRAGRKKQAERIGIFLCLIFSASVAQFMVSMRGFRAVVATHEPARLVRAVGRWGEAPAEPEGCALLERVSPQGRASGSAGASPHQCVAGSRAEIAEPRAVDSLPFLRKGRGGSPQSFRKRSSFCSPLDAASRRHGPVGKSQIHWFGLAPVSAGQWFYFHPHDR